MCMYRFYCLCALAFQIWFQNQRARNKRTHASVTMPQPYLPSPMASTTTTKSDSRLTPASQQALPPLPLFPQVVSPPYCVGHPDPSLAIDQPTPSHYPPSIQYYTAPQHQQHQQQLAWAQPHLGNTSPGSGVICTDPVPHWSMVEASTPVFHQSPSAIPPGSLHCFPSDTSLMYSCPNQDITTLTSPDPRINLISPPDESGGTKNVARFH